MNQTLQPEHRAILAEALRREEALAAEPEPPRWQTWEHEPWEEQREHGPRYGAGGWFGPLPEHQRQRYLRAIGALEAGGLLVTWRRHERRLSNLKLTDQGRALARELLAGGGSDQASGPAEAGADQAGDQAGAGQAEVNP